MADSGDAASAAGLSAGSQIVLSAVIGMGAGLTLYTAYLILRSLLRTTGWLSGKLSVLFSGSQKTTPSRSSRSSSGATATQSAKREPSDVPKHTMSLRQAKEAAKKYGGKAPKPQKHSHALFLGTLQGHQDNVTGCAVSFDSKLVATTCEDRVLRTFALDTAVRGPKHTSSPILKINLPKTPMGVSFGSSSDQLIVCTAGLLGHANLAMYTKAGGAEPVWELADCLSKKMVLAGGLASGYKLVQGPSASAPTSAFPIIAMGAGGGSTELRLFSAHGQCGGRQLERLDSGQMKNYMLAVSPDGRFVSVGAFTAEMKIWEVRHSREGAFTGVEMVLGLKGHTSQVKCVGFSSDSKRAVTASLDGTLGIWDIDVRYHLNEDAKRIVKANLPFPKGQCYDLLAVAPDSSGGCIAACHGSTLHFLCPKSGQLLDTVTDAHGGGIVQMVWTREPISTEKGAQAVLLTAGKDNNVRLWGCPTA
mmetsp:Transcript_22675/g.62967  ORF Transcript_22675/g.62967 Transcript_22675/m.62967 type:complete len:476 (-) Transcript_22675:80-1507(-)